MLPSRTVPSLVGALLPREAPRACADLLYDTLLRPPREEVARASLRALALLARLRSPSQLIPIMSAEKARPPR